MPMGKYDITLRHLIRSGGREFLRAIDAEAHAGILLRYPGLA
jgi:hypothetical protein